MGEELLLAPEDQVEAAGRYDLSEEEARGLCHEFLQSGETAVPGEKFGCYVMGSSSRFSSLGRFVESQVFQETFNNTPEVMDEEYAPYDQSSTFYLVVDHENEMPVGVMRVVANSPSGLKSLEDLKELDLGFTKDDVLKEYGVDPDKCADIATLAVLKDYRGAKAAYLPSLLMYRTLYKEVLSNPDFTHTVAIIDKKAEKNLQILKFPFHPILDSNYFSYLDSSESRALIAKNDEFYPQLTDWVKKLRDSNGSEQGISDQLRAATINALINDDYLDPMLATKK